MRSVQLHLIILFFLTVDSSHSGSYPLPCCEGKTFTFNELAALRTAAWETVSPGVYTVSSLLDLHLKSSLFIPVAGVQS